MDRPSHQEGDINHGIRHVVCGYNNNFFLSWEQRRILDTLSPVGRGSLFLAVLLLLTYVYTSMYLKHTGTAGMGLESLSDLLNQRRGQESPGPR